MREDKEYCTCDLTLGTPCPVHSHRDPFGTSYILPSKKETIALVVVIIVLLGIAVYEYFTRF